MEDEPGSDVGMMFSRVDLIYFRMGPLIYGKKGRIFMAHLYIRSMLLASTWSMEL